MSTDATILSELARVKATFQLRAISASIGIPPSAPPTPPADAVHAASSLPLANGNSQRSVEAGSERDAI